MRERPRELEVYRHFKGTYYQVIAVARHTEYDEELVIYRPLFEAGEVYARPLASFMSEVDKQAYPNARQKYRFTLASGEGHGGSRRESYAGTGVIRENVEKENISYGGYSTYTGSLKNEEEIGKDREIYEEEPREMQFFDSHEMGGVLDPDVEAFLDERSFEKKLDIFLLLRRKITDDMLMTIAIALDLRLTGETTEERYNEILDYIKMKRKYESDRLR